MSSIIQRLRRRKRSDATVIVECRHCGTTVERRDTACPRCGSGEIASYVI